MAEESAAPGPAWAAADGSPADRSPATGNPTGEADQTNETGPGDAETGRDETGTRGAQLDQTRTDETVLGQADQARLGGMGLGRTGDERVDEAVARLDELADTPLEEHPAILEQVHDRLREVLGEVSPGRPGSP